ncbi:MAG TPA: HNH endonuclease signature motif containing protein [Terriglobales bacterium]|nr:HNH endonuclease signature motif containing protein [Terriglobales bacterium]
MPPEMDRRLRQGIYQRAGRRREYCGLPQAAEPFFTYHVEHIVARQHGGRDDSENLALACYHCNAHKGPNLSALDPEGGALVRLFNPRQDQWNEHFERNGVLIIGRTAVGRATVSLLQMNAADRRRLREH